MSYYTLNLLEPFELARSSDINERLQQVAGAFDSLPSLDEFRLTVRTTVTAEGSANALTLASAGVDLADLAVGQRLSFKAAVANTGAATLNVDGLGAVSIRRSDGTALVAGDLLPGRVYDVVYDGAFWQLTNLTTVDLAAFVAAAASSAGAASTSAGEAAAAAGTAVTAAGEAQGHVTFAFNAASLAQAWANFTGGAVTGGEFSAKHYALLAAGYAASINPSNLVALAGGQTITGTKTFSAAIVANGGVTINGQTINALSAAGKAMVEATDAAAQAALLPAFEASAKGLVPSPGGTSNTTDFLRRDGSWAAPTNAAPASFSAIGSLVVAACDTLALGGALSPGDTVAGSTLVRDGRVDFNQYGVASLSARVDNGGTYFLNVALDGGAVSLGLTGTWRALGYAKRGSNSGQLTPLNLFQRIA